MTTATESQVFDIRTHNGRITASNPATGNHRTFRVRTQPQDAKFAPGKRVVSLLVGPDNESDYQGFAFVDEFGIQVWRSKLGGVYETYARMLANPDAWAEKGVEWQFEGRCRVCNRALTDPVSIELGIGPVCREQD